MNIIQNVKEILNNDKFEKYKDEFDLETNNLNLYRLKLSSYIIFIIMFFLIIFDLFRVVNDNVLSEIGFLFIFISHIAFMISSIIIFFGIKIFRINENSNRTKKLFFYSIFILILLSTLLITIGDEIHSNNIIVYLIVIVTLASFFILKWQTFLFITFLCLFILIPGILFIELPIEVQINHIINLVSFSVMANVISGINFTNKIREFSHKKEKEMLIHDLTEAVENIKILSGFLPICANCKNIRDDKGYWNQIETFIGDHSDAEFSHSICPDCAKKLYPSYDLSKNKSD